jgi:hypothetical protein
VLSTTSASTSLTSLAQNKGGGVARAVTLRLEDWVAERQESLTVRIPPNRGGIDYKESHAREAEEVRR